MERVATTTARRKWTEEEARAALDAWTRSGASEFAYARQHGFSPQRLRYWRSRLGVPTKQRAAPQAFVAVAMPIAAHAVSKIEIHVGGLSVCVREDLDVEHLASIVGALVRVRAC